MPEDVVVVNHNAKKIIASVIAPEYRVQRFVNAKIARIQKFIYNTDNSC